MIGSETTIKMGGMKGRGKGSAVIMPVPWHEDLPKFRSLVLTQRLSPAVCV